MAEIKLLMPPDTNTLFYKLYDYRKRGFDIMSKDQKIPIVQRKIVKDITERLNKDGYRVATFTGTYPPTFYVFTPIKVSHCLLGNVLLDTHLSASTIKQIVKRIKSINENAQVIFGVDPIDSSNK